MADSPSEIREKLRQRLKDEGRYDLAGVLTDCAEIVHMQCICCRSPVLVERGCGKRWCPVCAPRITAKRLDRLGRIAPRMQWPLAVTLTVKNKTHGADCIVHLKETFRKFRRTDFWADRVKGGVVGFEVTHRGNGWHPHLHALIDCRWLAVSTPEPTRWMTKRQQASLCKRAQYELSQVWAAYIGQDKAQVWAERAYGKAMEETLKYAIKPSDLLQCSCDAGDMIDEIDKGRMMGTFGNCHACSKEFVGMEEETKRERECTDCGKKKSIVPTDCLSRMMDRPEKLKPHWQEHLRTRYENLGMVRDSPEMRVAMNEPGWIMGSDGTCGPDEYDWWNDDE